MALTTLHETGHLAVPSEWTHDSLDHTLTQIDADMRLHVRGVPPAFDLDAATWAAQTLLEAARFLVHRQLDEATMRRALAETGPPPSAAAAWSVHLTFRFIPDIIRRAEAAASGDPLVELLRECEAAWAFSKWPDDSFIAGVLADQAPAAEQPPTLRTEYLIHD